MSLRFEGARTQLHMPKLRFHDSAEASQLFHANNTVSGINDDVTMAIWFKLTGPVPTSLDNNYKQNFIMRGHVTNSISYCSPISLLHYGSTSYSSSAPSDGMRFFYDRAMSIYVIPPVYAWASLYSNIVYPVANVWNLLVIRITPNNVDSGSNVGKIFLNGADITGGQTSMGGGVWGGIGGDHVYFGGHTMGELGEGSVYNIYYHNRFQGLISDFAVWSGAYWNTTGSDMFGMYQSKQRFNTWYPDKLKLNFMSNILTDTQNYSWFNSGFPPELPLTLTDGVGGVDVTHSDEPAYADNYYLENPLSIFNLLLLYHQNNIFFGFGDH